MKHSKAIIRARFHKIPTLRFEDQRLTSFAGLVLFQALFDRLALKARLKACFVHLDTSSMFMQLLAKNNLFDEPLKVLKHLTGLLLDCLRNQGLPENVPKQVLLPMQIRFAKTET